MKTAVIISNGSLYDYSRLKKYIDASSFVICADGGAKHVMKLGILPALLIGDLDSISESDLHFLTINNVEIKKFPAEKDMTDTELAVQTALNRGFEKIVLLGATGSRLDHSLSNIFLLKSIQDRGAQGIIADDNNEIMLTDKGVILEREEDMRVTLLSLTQQTEGVSTKGLLYPLHNATLSMGSSWGVSNEFISDNAEITLSKGLLLVIKSRD